MTGFAYPDHESTSKDGMEYNLDTVRKELGSQTGVFHWTWGIQTLIRHQRSQSGHTVQSDESRRVELGGSRTGRSRVMSTFPNVTQKIYK